MQFKISTMKNPTLKVELDLIHKDGLLVRLLEPVIYYRKGEPSDSELIDELGNPTSGYTLNPRKEIIVPTGYVSDGASIPKIFWFILSPFEDYYKCAIIHDYLCDLFHMGYIERKTCDKIFLEALQQTGVKFSTRYALYGFVRIYGMIRYNKLCIKLFGRGEVAPYNQEFLNLSKAQALRLTDDK